MHPLDWAVVALYLLWVVRDGVRRARRTGEVEGYFLANRALPWWAVGLSVMATQMSAITLVGTTGQGYEDGLRFVQFYFGLPLAMVILSVTLVPFFHRARVYTAYEYLEKRFDARTRALTSLLFLLSRGLSCGVIVAAPAVILSIVLGWSKTFTVVAIGLPTAVYTVVGGVQAVTWTDVKQMVVILLGVTAAIVTLACGIPADVSFDAALDAAASVGRLQALDFRFDLSGTYTFWSGLIGGLFLMLSYFGCDQSQVQRYLTARSVDEGRRSLLMSAYAKIPLQALILMTGVMVFAFYLFQAPPLWFNPAQVEQVRQSARAPELAALELRHRAALAEREAAARAIDRARASRDAEQRRTARQSFGASQRRVEEVHAEAATLVAAVTGASGKDIKDVNYVFPTFVTTRMRVGLTGLLIAAIFAAAMSSIAAELNALSAASTIDFYRRHLRPQASDREVLRFSKLSTAFWGVFAILVARFVIDHGSLIEEVNRLGSYFYGSILGVFVLALGVRRANGTGASLGLLAGMAAVWLTGRRGDVAFLWLNVVGVVTVVVVGSLVSLLMPPAREHRTEES